MPLGIGVATVGSSIAGGVIGSNAAAAGSQQLQQAAASGNQILSNVQNQTTGNLQPFVNNGQSESSALAGLLGVGGNPAASQNAFDNYLNSTNYQFQLGQGEQGIEYANAPSFNSSATAKALNNYAQGQAGSALAGYENLLQTGAGQGIAAGTSEANANTQNAANQASNLLSAASGSANLDLASASAITNALKGGVSGLSSFGTPGSGSALGDLFNGAYNAATGFTTSAEDT